MGLLFLGETGTATSLVATTPERYDPVMDTGSSTFLNLLREDGYRVSVDSVQDKAHDAESCRIKATSPGGKRWEVSAPAPNEAVAALTEAVGWDLEDG